MILKLFLFAAVLFSMSCTDTTRDNPNDPGGVNYQGVQSSDSYSYSYSSSSAVMVSSSSATPSSSSAKSSSSSITQSEPSSSSVQVYSSSFEVSSSSSAVVPSSSNSKQIQYGPSVNYGGETYKTVVIGTQTWFQRNLNYSASSYQCPNLGYNFYGYGDGCAIYGKLYDWTTAMDLTSNCYTSSCAQQIDPKHQGICPDGWHIPNNRDWDKLLRFVDGNNGSGSPYDSPTAGKYLKADSGWTNCSYPNCEDKFGFAALPGGYTGNMGGDGNIGLIGRWWTSSEDNANNAYYRGMHHSGEYVRTDRSEKYTMYSIRCLQNDSSIPEPEPSSSSSLLRSSSSSTTPSSSSSSDSSTACKDEQGRVYFCQWGSACWMLDLEYSEPPGKSCDFYIAACRLDATLFINSTTQGADTYCDGEPVY